MSCPRERGEDPRLDQMETHRDQKRQSARKHRERNIYSKKAVRAKEALLEKACAVPAKAPQTK